jgi:hypothetical protein
MRPADRRFQISAKLGVGETILVKLRGAQTCQLQHMLDLVLRLQVVERPFVENQVVEQHVGSTICRSAALHSTIRNSTKNEHSILGFISHFTNRLC